MENDSAQETLERLERYARSLSAPPAHPAPPVRPAAPARPTLPVGPKLRPPPPSMRPFLLPLLVRHPSVPTPAPVVDEPIVDTPVVDTPVVDAPVSPPAARTRKLTRRLANAAALTVAACSCGLAVAVLERLDGGAAPIAAAGLGAVALSGLVGRVPFARAWGAGVVVAALLVRFS